MNARALFLELVSRGVCPKTGHVPNTIAPEEIPGLLARAQANREGLREILVDVRCPDVLAVRAEGRA